MQFLKTFCQLEPVLSREEIAERVGSCCIGAIVSHASEINHGIVAHRACVFKDCQALRCGYADVMWLPLTAALPAVSVGDYLKPSAAIATSFPQSSICIRSKSWVSWEILKLLCPSLYMCSTMQMELAWEHSRNHDCHGQWEVSQAFDKAFCRVDFVSSKRSCRNWAIDLTFDEPLHESYRYLVCLNGVQLTWWGSLQGRRDLFKVQRAFCFPSFELTKPRGANIWRWSWEKQSIATAIAEFSAASWSINRSRLGRFTCLLVKELKGSGWLSKTVMIWAKCLGAMYAEHQPEAAKKACGFPSKNDVQPIWQNQTAFCFRKLCKDQPPQVPHVLTHGPCVTAFQATMKKLWRVSVKRRVICAIRRPGRCRVPGRTLSREVLQRNVVGAWSLLVGSKRVGICWSAKHWCCQCHCKPAFSDSIWNHGAWKDACCRFEAVQVLESWRNCRESRIMLYWCDCVTRFRDKSWYSRTSCLRFQRLPSAALWLSWCHVIAIDSSLASRFCWWLFEAKRSNSNFISAIFHLHQV